MSSAGKPFIVKPEPPDGPAPEQASETARISDPHARILDMPELRHLSASALAPVSGVYRVYHKDHRLPHSVYLAADEPLPACRVCGLAVEYGLLMTAPRPENDLDLGNVRMTGT
jgi:hypothetical protein